MAYWRIAGGTLKVVVRDLAEVEIAWIGAPQKLTYTLNMGEKL